MQAVLSTKKVIVVEKSQLLPRQYWFLELGTSWYPSFLSGLVPDDFV